ncbi:MAG: antirestriction protein ArdA [Alphaproteobacteria bacterium]|nr:antirestriction protein ArdA [Alphaproteobacteria bacterium]
MTKQEPEIRIYAACLASYNSGILHGRWIDVRQDIETIRHEIKSMLKESPVAGAQEYAIHNYEGFEGAPIEEHQNIESITEIAEFIAEYRALGGKLIEYYANLEDAKTAMEEDYAGAYAYVADFAQELTEETTEIPQNLQYYIDYERMAHDLEINDVLSIETGFKEVHLFWRR